MKCVAIVLLSMAVLGFAEEQQLHRQFDDVLIDALKQIIDESNKLQEALKTPNQEAVANTMKNQMMTFASKIETLLHGVSTQVQFENPELAKIWVNATTTVSKVFKDINAKVPKESYEQLTKKFQKGAQTLVKESNAIAEAIKAYSGTGKEVIVSFVNKAFENTIAVMQHIAKELQILADENKN